MSHYDILEVDQKASTTEIKQAFRKKSLQYHPDRNKSSDAHEYMTKITEAYNILFFLILFLFFIFYPS